jgi:hypothetical protein
MTSQRHCGSKNPATCTHPRCPDRVAFFQDAATEPKVDTTGQGPLARFNVDVLDMELGRSIQEAFNEFGYDEGSIREIERYALQDLQDTYRVSHRGELDLYADPTVLADLRTTIRARVNAEF